MLFQLSQLMAGSLGRHFAKDIKLKVHGLAIIAMTPARGNISCQLCMASCKEETASL
jgi:hypothetical protein